MLCGDPNEPSEKVRTNNELPEKEIAKTSPFTIASKRMKHSAVSLTKVVKTHTMKSTKHH